MSKIIYFLLINTFLYSKTCHYPYAFKFNDTLFYPIFVSYTEINKGQLHTELALKTSRDEYVTLLDSMPAIYTVKKKNIYLNHLQLNKNLSSHDFKKEILKKNIRIKIYNNKFETMIVVFDKKNKKLMGTLLLRNSSQSLLQDIISTLTINQNTCKENKYWTIYLKTDNHKINTKLKILYSILLLNPSSKAKKEILKVLKNKQDIIDLAITNLNECLVPPSQPIIPSKND